MEERDKIFDENIEESLADEYAADKESEDTEAKEADITEEILGSDADTNESANQEDAQEQSPDSEENCDSGKKSKIKKTFGKKKSTAAIELELEKEKAKVEELTDKYQRLMAEFENMRKRNAKEQSRMFDVGAKSVLEKLLPVVDNFERGLSGTNDMGKDDPFVQGVEKIYQQLMTTLDDIGVKPMNAKGSEFNPDFHNAVMHSEDDQMGENLVLEEFQKGYMYKDGVLRFAMVSVVN